jgi:hypothetical protein
MKKNTASRPYTSLVSTGRSRCRAAGPTVIECRTSWRYQGEFAQASAKIAASIRNEALTAAQHRRAIRH